MKLLTEFDGHPAILRAGLSATGLYARSLAYAGRYETDGDIPESWVAQALASAKQELKQELGVCQALVEQGLWEKTDFGYRIVGFTEVNYSHEEMERLRKTRSRAGKKGGKSKQAKAKASAIASVKQNNSYSSSTSNSSSSSSNKEPKKHSADEDIEWLEDYAVNCEASEGAGI